MTKSDADAFGSIKVTSLLSGAAAFTTGAAANDARRSGIRSVNNERQTDLSVAGVDFLGDIKFSTPSRVPLKSDKVELEMEVEVLGGVVISGTGAGANFGIGVGDLGAIGDRIWTGAFLGTTFGAGLGLVSMTSEHQSSVTLSSWALRSL